MPAPILLSEASEKRAQRSAALPRAVIPALFALGDVFAILLANVLAIALYQGSIAPTVNVRGLSMTFGEMAVVVFLLLAWARGFYGNMGRDVWDGIGPSITMIALVWAAVVGTITIIMFALKIGASFSRGEVILFFSLGCLLLVAFRAITERVVRRGLLSGAIASRDAVLLVIGEDKRSRQIIDDGAIAGLRVREIWTANRVTPASAGKLGREMIARARGAMAGELLIAAPAKDIDRVKLVAEALQLAPLRVRLVMDPDLAWIAGSSGLRIGGSVAVELSREPLNWAERTAKRAFDVALALTALVALAPFLLLVALAIRIETRGPVLFRQSRDGFGDRSFLIYKFRSMKVMENGPVVVQATRGDDRVTRVGSFIRRTSIDELPQLLNVLRGDMSIIGPRPHAIAHGEHYSRMIGDYAHRHHVKPGLTGWAQVNGSRGETPTVDSMKRRVDLDLWYIGNWSFWLDIKIIALTIRQVFNTRNAY